MPQVSRKVTTVITEGSEGADVKETCSSNVFEFFDTKKVGEDWDIGYLYRTAPKIEGQEGYLMKFTEPITLDFVRERFGGHLFRVLLKKGPQRVCEGKMAIEAPPRMQTDDSNYNQRLSSNGTNTGTDGLARHAMDLVADPSKASIGIALQTAQTGFDIVRAQMAASVDKNQLGVKDMFELVDRMVAARTVAPAPGMPAWLETALAAAIPALLARILTPENPIETFKNLASALQSMPGMKGSANDWKASIVEVLPQLAERGTQMMQEWRLATEAAAGAQRRLSPAPPTGPVLVAPLPQNPQNLQNLQNPAVAAVDGATPTPGGPVPPPPENWLKMKLVEMFQAGRTGEEVGEFMDEIAPAFLDDLSKYTAKQLHGYLSIDPILKAVAGDPRALEFLEQLIAWANAPETEAAAQAVATQKPA